MDFLVDLLFDHCVVVDDIEILHMHYHRVFPLSC